MRELFNAALNIDDHAMSKDELIEAVKKAHVLVPTVTDEIDADVIAAAGDQLKLIANFGAGYEHINIEAARTAARDLATGQVPMEKLTMSKQLAADYKVAMPHVNVRNKIRLRAPGSEPQQGDRVPFVIVEGPRNAKMFEKGIPLQPGGKFLLDHGAYPSTLGYRGYPKSLCTSLNEVICHGIPDSTVLMEGDICNIDITAYLDGVHGDTNATFLAGEVDVDSAILGLLSRPLKAE